MTKELSMQELLDQQEQLLNSIKVGETITWNITKIKHNNYSFRHNKTSKTSVLPRLFPRK